MKSLKRFGIWVVLIILTPLAYGGVGFTTLVSFEGTNGPAYGSVGSGPNSRTGAMVLGNDGNFYGTTSRGGTNRRGTVFQLTPRGQFRTIYQFGSVVDNQGNALDGYGPCGNLIQAGDGNLYGTTDSGGVGNTGSGGTVFQITTNGVLTSLYSFPQNSSPLAGVVQGSDGNFYGTTQRGGAHGTGTVFQMTPLGVLSTLYSFTALDPNSYTNSDGAEPHGELVQGPDGNFYGTTPSGGPFRLGGTVFKITPDGTLTTLHAFSGLVDGAGPDGGLVLGQDGNLYGTTVYGGSTQAGDLFGTVFKITRSGALTTLHSFGLIVDGAEPIGGLIQASDGNLYGTTLANTAFQITPNGAFTTLHHFSRPDGVSPAASLAQGPDGSLWGTTISSGAVTSPQSPAAGNGTVFRLIIPPAAQMIAMTNGVITFGWRVMSNQTCQLQFTTNAASINWINLGKPMTTTGPTLTGSDSIAGDPKRFYRWSVLTTP